MSDTDSNAPSPRQLERNELSEVFHSLSQPLTALQCGLEVSLRQDKTAARLRARMASALEATRLLRQRLLEARALQDAGDAGDIALPVPVATLLSVLQEDFLPVARSSKVKLSMNFEPAMVRGNEVRIRNGFFHLFELLLRVCPPRHSVRLRGVRISSSAYEVRFAIDGPPETGAITPAQVASPSDMGFRIARRIFQAADGDLVVSQDGSGQIAGHVRLLLAK